MSHSAPTSIWPLAGILVLVVAYVAESALIVGAAKLCALPGLGFGKACVVTLATFVGAGAGVALVGLGLSSLEYSGAQAPQVVIWLSLALAGWIGGIAAAAVGARALVPALAGQAWLTALVGWTAGMVVVVPPAVFALACLWGLAFLGATWPD